MSEIKPELPASYPSLIDRVVFISGGASGIGAALVVGSGIFALTRR